ncbi:MAG: sugar kinase [Sphingobacteriales bacterium]|nr:MAG: sugar kinase [Sphingobacteriales bacterium]
MSQQNNNAVLSNKNQKTRVFCFGELLLRMSPSLGRQWIHSNQMPVYIGGAELNVATALANWKIPVTYSTALPKNYLSDEILEELQSKNIGTDKVHFSGNRIGAYYLPQGADLKNAGVIYDRAHSSFAELKPGMIDWDEYLDGCSWFHFSAISPALNNVAPSVCEEALKVAKAKGLIISVDLNYRAKLWKYGKEPVEVMPSLVEYCDLVMGNIWSAAQLLGTPLDQSLIEPDQKDLYLEHGRKTSMAIMQKFNNCQVVANTFRFDAGTGIKYYASLDTKQEQSVSTEFRIDQVVDKIGSGDCFMAGLIYGLYHQHTPAEVINFAAAAAFGKLQEKSDATSQRIENVNEILKKYGSAG